MVARSKWWVSLNCRSSGGSTTTTSFTVGNVLTVPYGTPATVTNSGDDTDIVLNFGIPGGKPGDVF